MRRAALLQVLQDKVQSETAYEDTQNKEGVEVYGLREAVCSPAVLDRARVHALTSKAICVRD